MKKISLFLFLICSHAMFSSQQRSMTPKLDYEAVQNTKTILTPRPVPKVLMHHKPQESNLQFCMNCSAEIACCACSMFCLLLIGRDFVNTVCNIPETISQTTYVAAKIEKTINKKME